MAYHFTSLLSCLGKVVENGVTKLLSEDAEQRGLVSNGQFGSRKEQSAIDPTTIMVDRSQACWNKYKI